MIDLVIPLAWTTLILIGQTAIVWAMVCNYKTHGDKIMILEAVRLRPDLLEEVIAAFRAVSYERHMRARILLRDPWALYPSVIREVIDNPLPDGTLVMVAKVEMVPPPSGPSIH